jgi:nucleoside-diphosphate-sugar epimerase
MADPTHPIDESGTLAPVSLYAEQKVAVERHLLALEPPAPAVTCLRFATLYGEAPRMRFDLTVNEFTRDLWAARTVEVYGRQFWRPYVHVRDAAHAIELVLTAPIERVAGEIFNVGDSHENYRKLEIVEQIHKQIDRGRVVYVERDEDPRDYKVSFDKISRALDYSVTMRVPDGISELIDALDAGRFPDAFDPRYSNIA